MIYSWSATTDFSYRKSVADSKYRTAHIASFASVILYPIKGCQTIPDIQQQKGWRLIFPTDVSYRSQTTLHPRLRQEKSTQKRRHTAPVAYGSDRFSLGISDFVDVRAIVRH